jgi:hypothetical protein
MSLEAVAASASRGSLEVSVDALPKSKNDPLFGQRAGMMPKLDRLALATKFVMALQDVSRRNPTSWRRVSAIGARTGIKGADLERVVADVVAAGLVEQRADDPCVIILTNRGGDLASSVGRYGESVPLLTHRP